MHHLEPAIKVLRYLPGVVRSRGCTEPGAIAFAASLAATAVGGAPQAVDVRCDRNTLKNAFAAGIPGTGGLRGIRIAAALGAVAGDPERRLEALAGISNADLQTARQLIADGGVTLSMLERSGPARIEVQVLVTTSAGRGKAVIAGSHTHVQALEVDGRPRELPGQLAEAEQESAQPNWTGYTLARVLSLAEELDEEDARLLREGAQLNRLAAQAAFEGSALQPGLLATLWAGEATAAPTGRVSAQTACEAESLAAAGSFARMSGLPVTVVTSGFSGNQGMVATLPVLAVAREVGADDGQLARALATSHLVGQYFRSFCGLLSPLCHALQGASAGAAAACVRLLGGDAEDAARACSIVAAGAAGSLCDGAKPGCSIKVGMGAAQAIRAALLARQGFGLDGRNGIVGDDPAHTARNLGRLAHPALAEADAEILRILLEKDPDEGEQSRG